MIVGPVQGWGFGVPVRWIAAEKVSGVLDRDGKIGWTAGKLRKIGWSARDLIINCLEH